MAQIDEFFIDANRVEGITEADYAKAMPLVEAAKAFAKTTYQSVYIIDYFRKNFLYVSDNPLFLCGHTAEDVQQMGYGFYMENVPQEELSMLLELNEAGFQMSEKMTEEEMTKATISYDFHLQASDHRTLIHHKLTPMLLSNGRIWLALCTVSLSSQKDAGHINMRIKGKSYYWEYSLERHRWEECEPITLKPEERHILTLAAQGYSIKDISERLFRGVDTVKFHRRNLFEKFGVESITEAVAFATNYGLI